MVDLVHNAGIRIRELEAEVARLRRRLEITHAYDGTGNEIPFPAGMETDLDGIACRDETIRQQDAQIERLKAEVARLTPAPSRPADRGLTEDDLVLLMAREWLNACDGDGSMIESVGEFAKWSPEDYTACHKVAATILARLAAATHPDREGKGGEPSNG